MLAAPGLFVGAHAKVGEAERLLLLVVAERETEKLLEHLQNVVLPTLGTRVGSITSRSGAAKRLCTTEAKETDAFNT